MSSSSRSAAGLSITETHRPRSVPSASTTRCTDQVVDPDLVGIVDRFGVDLRAGEGFGGGAVVDAGQVHPPPAVRRMRPLDRPPIIPDPQTRADRGSFDPVGGQVEEHVTPDSVCPADLAHLEQFIRSRHAVKVSASAPHPAGHLLDRPARPDCDGSVTCDRPPVRWPRHGLLASPNMVVDISSPSVAAGPGRTTGQLGVIVFLASDIMLFAPFFAAYFLLRSTNDPWPSAGVELDTLRLDRHNRAGRVVGDRRTRRPRPRGR